MSKKLLVLCLIFVFLILLGVAFLLYSQKRQTLVNPFSSPGKKVILPEGKQGGLLFYEDEAGFSFQYPPELGIIEKEVNDPNVYSSLELLAKRRVGEKLVVRISDTNSSTVEKWLEKNPQEGKILNSVEFTLFGMKGKSLRSAAPAKNLILVIESGILYLLSAPSDGDFWDESLQTIASSFKLTEEKTTSPVGGGASIIEEEEEVIQ